MITLDNGIKVLTAEEKESVCMWKHIEFTIPAIIENWHEYYPQWRQGWPYMALCGVTESMISDPSTGLRTLTTTVI